MDPVKILQVSHGPLHTHLKYILQTGSPSETWTPLAIVCHRQFSVIKSLLLLQNKIANILQKLLQNIP